MKTAKALGLKKGDYCMNDSGFLCKITAYANTATPECEVWGLYHEFGSVYAEELHLITEEQAKLFLSTWEGQ